jgi:hypothetical protein
MTNEQEIIQILKKEQGDISQHPKLTELSKLYDYCISLHESRWLEENGIIVKSALPDLKTILDDVGMENKRNNEELEILEKCEDCSNETDEEVRFIKFNKLGMLTIDD